MPPWLHLSNLGKCQIFPSNRCFRNLSPTFPTSLATRSNLGEVVIFDRSWYNRAGVERVMYKKLPREKIQLPKRLQSAVNGAGDHNP